MAKREEEEKKKKKEKRKKKKKNIRPSRNFISVNLRTAEKRGLRKTVARNFAQSNAIIIRVVLRGCVSSSP